MYRRDNSELKAIKERERERGGGLFAEKHMGANTEVQDTCIIMSRMIQLDINV